MAVIDVKGADWYHVRLQDGTIGYISSKLIVPPEIVDTIHNYEQEIALVMALNIHSCEGQFTFQLSIR